MFLLRIVVIVVGEQLLAQLLLPFVDVLVQSVPVLADGEFLVVIDRDEYFLFAVRFVFD